MSVTKGRVQVYAIGHSKCRRLLVIRQASCCETVAVWTLPLIWWLIDHVRIFNQLHIIWNISYGQLCCFSENAGICFHAQALQGFLLVILLVLFCFVVFVAVVQARLINYVLIKWGYFTYIPLFRRLGRSLISNITSTTYYFYMYCLTYKNDLSYSGIFYPTQADLQTLHSREHHAWLTQLHIQRQGYWALVCSHSCDIHWELDVGQILLLTQPTSHSL